MSSKYTGTSLDLQEIGREMRVASIVTGNHLKQGDRLPITLEAIDAVNNRTLWRDTLNTSFQNLIAMPEDRP
jgi:TolB-like protein